MKRHTHARTQRRQGRLLLWGVGALTLLGCSRSEGPPRYELSGTVTYNGQPLPAGEVAFVPDNGQNNRGPGAIGVVQNGKYRTYPEHGVVGGPHRVTIVGYNATPGTVADASLRELFPVYETKVDLPRESAEIDFDVPAR